MVKKADLSQNETWADLSFGDTWAPKIAKDLDLS